VIAYWFTWLFLALAIAFNMYVHWRVRHDPMWPDRALDELRYTIRTFRIVERRKAIRKYKQKIAEGMRRPRKVEIIEYVWGRCMTNTEIEFLIYGNNLIGGRRFPK